MMPEPLWGSDSFRRLMGWSAGAHLLLLLLMIFGAGPWSRSRSDSVVFVDVIAAAIPQPAPAAPAKKQVVDEAVVIPKQPKKLVKKKPAKKKVEKKPEPPGPSAQELLAQMRERQAASTVVADIRSKHEAGRQAGRTGRVDPRAKRYIDGIEACIYSKLTWRDTAPHPDAEVLFDFDIDASGRLVSVQIARGSGNRFLDESAERAIWKCQPFGAPPPQMPLQFTLNWRPGDRF
jgi:protein TonB